MTYEELALALRSIAQEKSEWAGLPIPVNDLPLHLEPRFPYQFDEEEQPKTPAPDIVNQWFSRKFRCDIVVVREQGKSRVAYLPCGSGFTMLINTIGASCVWPLSAEKNALNKLEALINDWKLRCYYLTGSFLESSPRSKVTYLFRRLRPTVAFKDDKVLCTLCLHPIGYYDQSYAGVMAPTDDVIAHLVMMRGDEKKFWANANQHPIWHPASALT